MMYNSKWRGEWNTKTVIIIVLIPPSFLALLPECYSYGYLDDSARAQSFFNGYYGYAQCDGGLPFGWYRFSGAAGTHMPTSCVGQYHCSTHAPGWLSTPHPSVDDGIVNGTVCFHWGTCCQWPTNIRVRNCGRFYVYELRPTIACSLRYCGNGGGTLHFLRWTRKRTGLCGRRKQGKGEGEKSNKGKRVPFLFSPVPSPFPPLSPSPFLRLPSRLEGYDNLFFLTKNLF